MRRIAALSLGLAITTAPARVDAISCSEPPWSELISPIGVRARDVPVDARPWIHEFCQGDLTYEDCVLVDEDEIIPVLSETDGDRGCDTTDSHFEGPFRVRRFIPDRPLTPGSSYDLECDGQRRGELTVRTDMSPAAPPMALEVARAYYARDADSCCAHGDTIELTFADLDAPYLKEGGYIEVTYPNGETIALTKPDDEDPLVLPGTREQLKFAPVSASGERGEELLFDPRHIDGDLVYVACGVTGVRSPLTLWLLVPFLYIAARRVRRRAS